MYMKFVILTGGRFCSFSPCIEQSQRCCIALQEQGFTEIQSYEVLQQEDIVKTKTFPVMNLEFLKHKVKYFKFSDFKGFFLIFRFSRKFLKFSIFIGNF